MNGRQLMVTSVAFFTLLIANPVSSQDELESLRGMTAIDEPSPTPYTKPRQQDHRPITRDFVQQPPLIPHSTKGYKINKNFNKCLTCHSWANYEESGATKVSQTHFVDRDGNALANVSASRYFCTQCHVEQLDVDPLVENEFEAVDTLR